MPSGKKVGMTTQPGSKLIMKYAMGGKVKKNNKMMYGHGGMVKKGKCK
tara:strand:- start:18 stop:161 length:144 start_codon:yes stop_codon:yes gene_type:complete